MRRSTTLTTGWSCLEPVRNVLLLVRPSDSLPSVTRERRRSGRASAIRSSHSRSLRKSSNTNISGDSLRSCADARGGPRGDSAGEVDREGLRRREARCAAGGSRRGGTLFFFSAEVSPTSRDASPLRPPSASSPSASSYPESSYPESSPPSRARGGSSAAASATKRSATSSWNERQTSASPTSASRDAKPLRAPRSRGALVSGLLFLEIFVVGGVAGDVEGHRFSPARFAGRQHERVCHEPVHSKAKSVRARKREENAPPGPARARARASSSSVFFVFPRNDADASADASPATPTRPLEVHPSVSRRDATISTTGPARFRRETSVGAASSATEIFSSFSSRDVSG